MKLLFDQNLSFRLRKALAAGVFADATQVHRIGIGHAEDRLAELAALLGPPPRVIWLRCGSQPTAAIAALLVRHLAAINAFERDEDAACLELY